MVSKYKSLAKYLTYRFIERVFLFVTGNWKIFYGWYLDRQDQKKSAHELRELGIAKRQEGFDKGLYDTSMGDYHLEFLISHGLRQSSKFFDLGFGFGRTAIPVIRFLEKGKSL